MSRLKGSKNIQIKDLFNVGKNLRKRANGNRPRWEKINYDTGTTIEQIGRMIRGRGRKYPKTWNPAELYCLANTLRDCIDVIEMQAQMQVNSSQKKQGL